jgi:exoribonuclease R
MNEIGRLLLNNKSFYSIHNKTYRKCYSLSSVNEKEIYIQTKKSFQEDLYIKYDPSTQMITETLGTVLNPKDDLSIFYHLYTLNWMSDKKFTSLFETISLNSDIAVSHRTEFYPIVYTVDPEHSIDLDDGFSIHKNHLYIHIADPVSYMTTDTLNLIFDELNTRLSTCYLDKTRHLFPLDWMKNMSLLGNQKRTLCLDIEMNDNGEIISYTFKNYLAVNIQNYTYQKFEKMLHSNIDLKKKCETIKFQLQKQFTIVETDFIHDWIQLLMITFNYYMTLELLKKDKLCILRELESIEKNICIPSSLLSCLKYRAYYSIYNKDTNKGHSQLHLPYYSHCSSPLRRFIDFINHYIYYYNDDILSKIDISIINKKLTQYKRYSISYQMIQSLQIQNHFQGIILEMDEQNVTLIVYNETLQKVMKIKKPVNIDILKPYTKVNVEMNYNPTEYKSSYIPFSITFL